MSKKEKTIYQKAIEKWGVDAQVGMMQEECIELALAIRKLQRDGESKFDDFIDEVAEVTIMAEQMATVPGWREKINERIAFKLNRLNDRIINDKF